MKLRQRIWICVLALVAASLVTLLLGTVSMERVPAEPGYDAGPNEGPPKRVDVDAPDSGDSVATLVRALRRLAERTSSEVQEARERAPEDGRRRNANERPVYLELAEKLLRDRSFNVSENVDDDVDVLIRLGKTLETSVQRRGVSRNNTSRMAIDDRSGETRSGSRNKMRGEAQDSKFGRYPEFHLKAEILTKLSHYINMNMNKHKRFKRTRIFPMKYKLHTGKHLHNWQLWQNAINHRRLYDGNSPVIDELLKDMAYGRITGMSTMSDYGTQIKLIFRYDDKSKALFKPMRFRRDQERDPNLFYFDDFERHHAEIAAFHLDRVMEFYRVPPNVGRLVNITSDIEPFASLSFKRTIFISPAGNKCFYGKCDYYCDSGHPVCGTPDVVEGSLAAWLPFSYKLSKTSWENPWKRSYSKFHKAEWETDPTYCDMVKKTKPYNTGHRLLDLLDITIFDYLAGNQDRHHFHTFKLFGNNSSPVLYDNGRGFGWIYFDDISILAPVIQCCQIRFTTLAKLVQFEKGPNKLSVVMAESLAKDPLSSGPNGLILSEGHLRALDRRVSQILDAVWNCCRRHGMERVIIDDGI